MKRLHRTSLWPMSREFIEKISIPWDSTLENIALENQISPKDLYVLMEIESFEEELNKKDFGG